MCIVQRFIFGQVFTLFMTFKAKSGYMFQVNMNEKTGRIRITTFFFCAEIHSDTTTFWWYGGLEQTKSLRHLPRRRTVLVGS